MFFSSERVDAVGVCRRAGGVLAGAWLSVVVVAGYGVPAYAAAGVTVVGHEGAGDA